MNWNIVSQYILNGISLEFYLSFYIFALIGMTFTMLVHFQQMRTQKKKSNEEVKFNFIYWIKRNGVRFLTNLLAVFILIRFKDNLKISNDLSMFLGFVIGMSIDGLILLIRNIKIGTK